MLVTLPETLRALLVSGDADDPVLKRLYPSAFIDDEEASVEFDAIVHDDLLEQRLAAIDTMERTLQARHLTEDELVAWGWDPGKDATGKDRQPVPIAKPEFNRIVHAWAKAGAVCPR